MLEQLGKQGLELASEKHEILLHQPAPPARGSERAGWDRKS